MFDDHITSIPLHVFTPTTPMSVKTLKDG